MFGQPCEVEADKNDTGGRLTRSGRISKGKMDLFVAAYWINPVISNGYAVVFHSTGEKRKIGHRRRPMFSTNAPNLPLSISNSENCIRSNAVIQSSKN